MGSRQARTRSRRGADRPVLPRLRTSPRGGRPDVFCALDRRRVGQDHDEGYEDRETWRWRTHGIVPSVLV